MRLVRMYLTEERVYQQVQYLIDSWASKNARLLNRPPSNMQHVEMIFQLTEEAMNYYATRFFGAPLNEDPSRELQSKLALNIYVELSAMFDSYLHISLGRRFENTEFYMHGVKSHINLGKAINFKIRIGFHRK